MSFEQYMNEVEDTNFQVGDIVLGRAIWVDPDQGIYVRFGGPGDGFVPVDELAMLNTNPDFCFEYATDGTYWLEIVDLDNTDRPIQLSEVRALGTVQRNGINTEGIRGEYSHFTGSGSPKRQFHHRELAAQRINEIRRTDKAARLVPYICKACKCWHIGNDR